MKRLKFVLDLLSVIVALIFGYFNFHKVDAIILMLSMAGIVFTMKIVLANGISHILSILLLILKWINKS